MEAEVGAPLSIALTLDGLGQHVPGLLLRAADASSPAAGILPVAGAQLWQVEAACRVLGFHSEGPKLRGGSRHEQGGMGAARPRKTAITEAQVLPACVSSRRRRRRDAVEALVRPRQALGLAVSTAFKCPAPLKPIV